MSTAPAAVKPVQIDAAVLEALRAKAKTLSAQTGARVTIRSLIEEAVIARWPELAGAPPPQAEGTATAAVAAPHDPSTIAFNKILDALYGAASVIAANAAIQALDGSVSGSLGQPISLRDLAYHLRSAEAPIASLAELVRDYEFGGHAAPQLSERC